MDADRNHIHHILIDAGYPAQRMVMLLHAVAAFMGLAGLAMHASGVPEGLMFLLFLVICAIYFIVVDKLQKRLRGLAIDRSS